MAYSKTKSPNPVGVFIALILTFSTLMGMSALFQANAEYVYRYDLERKMLEYEITVEVFAGEHSRDMDIMASGKWKGTIESLEDAKYRLTITNITIKSSIRNFMYCWKYRTTADSMSLGQLISLIRKGRRNSKRMSRLTC